MQLSVIVPTFNESANVNELVSRLCRTLDYCDAEVIFVDDSTDDTPDVIRSVAESSAIAVRLIHRDQPEGGLGGAVTAGLRAARANVCVVMDGDLQHPPEDVERLHRRYQQGDVDVVVASRYIGGGSSDGLAGITRSAVSRASTSLAKAMFPLRLRGCSDPMTGFFLVDRSRLDISALQPRGFKILLEILARNTLRIGEIPFHFAERFAGQSKASFRQGANYVLQLAALRFGRMSGFALIGAGGAVLNLLIVWCLTTLGLGYLAAAVIAAETTIILNFVLMERFVFRDMRDEARTTRSRFIASFSFNNAEAVIRIPVMALLVESWHISAVFATALTLVAAFVVRFLFHSLVVYAPSRRFQESAQERREADTLLRASGEL